MDWPVILALITLVSSGIGTAGALVWKLTRVETSLRADIIKSRQEGDARQDQHARDVGESLSALRTKVNEVELHVRDHYLRRDSFVEVHRQMSSDMRTLREELLGRLDRLDAKLDARGKQ